ncbi:MAG: adenine deaminase [Candidatus Tritonobacter lacicola]|nr:adenine deaminase [Candidatus Tritonobacter lacicola]
MKSLAEQIKVARGLKKADLVLKRAKLINVFSSECYVCDIAINGDAVVGIGKYSGKQEIDLKGRYAAPGFIDGHLHVESSMVTIPDFARAVVPLGTTSIVIDPHEIANVMGLDGINYMLKASKYNPLSVFIMLSSCVPATGFETSGADLRAADLFPYFQQEWILGLAEVMDFPGLLRGNPDILDKIRLAADKKIDGHAPRLSGKDLNAYIAAGIRSDHECTTADEAREKLRLGMTIMIREGGLARDMEALLPIVTPENERRCLFCTDDRHPQDLVNEGHMNYILKRAVSLGLDPITAIRMATINTAEYFGLGNIGAIAPGYTADIAIFDSLKNFNVTMTFKRGKLVARDGAMLPGTISGPRKGVLRGSINIQWLKPSMFVIKDRGKRCRVIDIIPGQLITKQSIFKPKVENGKVVPDTRRDILKLVVVERHHASTNIGIGLVKGFGLKKGALASSVAHDSHNIIAVGTNDADIMEAIVKIRKMQGGFTAIHDGNWVGRLELPIAGLMSEKRVDEVKTELDMIIGVAHDLGCKVKDPFMMLSFLALPVIPRLKLTDRGLVDVNQHKLVPLFV